MSYHQPVMLRESIEALNLKPGGIYVDATFGGGGHSRAILQQLEGGRLIAFDQDPDALANAPDDDRFTLVQANFEHLRKFLRLHHIQVIDGLLADLGVSSHQIDTADRGFSTRFSGPLSMRMDRADVRNASEVLNTYSAEELSQIFKEFGDVTNARALSRSIVQARSHRPFEATDDLVRVATAVAHGPSAKYLAKVFQAIRIEVNREVEVLKSLLTQAADSLAAGGRLVVISYHSLEDRLVKNYVRRGGFQAEVVTDMYGTPQRLFAEVNRRPLQPSSEEIKQNPRARSARLRVAERLAS